MEQELSAPPSLSFLEFSPGTRPGSWCTRLVLPNGYVISIQQGLGLSADPPGYYSGDDQEAKVHGTFEVAVYECDQAYGNMSEDPEVTVFQTPEKALDIIKRYAKMRPQEPVNEVTTAWARGEYGDCELIGLDEIPDLVACDGVDHNRGRTIAISEGESPPPGYVIGQRYSRAEVAAGLDGIEPWEPGYSPQL